MRGLRLRVVVAAGFLVGGCATATPVIEQTTRGPIAQEIQIARSFAANGRDLGWDEKRHYEEDLEERVFKYLRAQPRIWTLLDCLRRLGGGIVSARWNP